MAIAKTTAKLSATAKSIVDELAASNPELLAHLIGILEGLMGAETAVAVPVKGKKKASASVDLDDEDGDEDSDLEDGGDDEEADEGEGDDSDLEDEDLPVATKGKAKSSAKSTKTAKAAAPAKGGKKRVAAVEEDDEDADADNGSDEVEAPEVDFDDLETSTIVEAFEEIEAAPMHERVEALSGSGLRELAETVNEYGFDAKALLASQKKITTPADKKAFYLDVLSRANFVIDAIMQFEDGDVLATVQALDEDYKPSGRGSARAVNNATALFAAAVAAEAE